MLKYGRSVCAFGAAVVVAALATGTLGVQSLGPPQMTSDQSYSIPGGSAIPDRNVRPAGTPTPGGPISPVQIGMPSGYPSGAALPEEVKPGQPEKLRMAADAPSIAVSSRGSIDYGDEIIGLSNDVWLLLGPDSASIAWQDSPDTMTIVGSGGEAHVRLTNNPPYAALMLLQESAQIEGPISPDCGPGRFLCHFSVSAENACGPEPMHAYKCCNDGQWCYWSYGSPEGETCISGVAARCSPLVEP